MAETINQPRKLYGIDFGWRLGQITEYDVLKETPKTYVVSPSSDKSINSYRCTNVVCKSNMSLCDKKFAVSYPEAIELLKEGLRNRIDCNTNKIKRINIENERCEAILKEIEEGRNNG